MHLRSTFYLIVVALIHCAVTSSCAQQQAKTYSNYLPNGALIKIKGQAMGTTYSILYYQQGSNVSPKKVKKKIQQKLLEINKIFSTYDNTSEVAIFNATENTNWQTISDTLYALSLSSIQVSKHTDGAFDITVQPLVELWRFNSNRFNKQNHIPTAQEISNTLLLVGYQKINLQIKTNGNGRHPVKQIKKANQKMRLDFSAIAKGYGVDEVSLLLTTMGYPHHLVEIGGELKARGKKLNNSHQPTSWIVGIIAPKKKPFSQQNHALEKIVLFNEGIATSGDYENYITDNNKRYTHIIDTKTGVAKTGEVSSVSVIAESTAEADAYATALLAMEKEKLLQWIDNNTVKAYIIYRNEQGNFSTRYSKSFASNLVSEILSNKNNGE